ncbi:hypothetical protein GECvBGOT_gp191 [Salmonella phage GEC_vB_GOT]|nr:hypothetical protein GECvBGOT_gp191 [Salmonella phage GEC_vB_GOT]
MLRLRNPCPPEQLRESFYLRQSAQPSRRPDLRLSLQRRVRGVSGRGRKSSRQSVSQSILYEES